MDSFAPSLSGDQSFRIWHQRYERSAASTDSLRDLLALTLNMDVREVLSTLDLPTLVLHRTNDQIVPIEYGRELAEGIPGARLVELDGNDHFSYVVAARRLAKQELHEGDSEAASSLARRLIEADKYDEDAHRMLISALHIDGESGEARRRSRKLSQGNG